MWRMLTCAKCDALLECCGWLPGWWYAVAGVFWMVARWLLVGSSHVICDILVCRYGFGSFFSVSLWDFFSPDSLSSAKQNWYAWLHSSSHQKKKKKKNTWNKRIGYHTTIKWSQIFKDQTLMEVHIATAVTNLSSAAHLLTFNSERRLIALVKQLLPVIR